MLKYKCPAYTSYELSEMVKRKRKEMRMSETDFANRFNADVKSVQQIEDGTMVFTKKLYDACSNILEIPVCELIDVENDEPGIMILNKDNDSLKTFELANMLMYEIILQCKLSARRYR